MARAAFLAYMIGRYLAGQDRSCPHCGGNDTTLVARKKLVLQLRHCAGCGLMFRYPKEEPERSRHYYQDDYADSIVTSLPDAAGLAALKANGFAGGPLDMSGHVAQLRAAGAAGRLLDLGCSWGYAVWQFRQAGFDAVGFEISQPRARYGRDRLGVEIMDLSGQLDALPNGAFDAVHTSHVLEHVPDPGAALRLIRRLLKPGGPLLIYVPNGDGDAARRLGTAWGGSISEEHVLAFTAPFFAANLPRYGFADLRFNCDPYDAPPVTAAEVAAGRRLAGEELMVLAR